MRVKLSPAITFLGHECRQIGFLSLYRPSCFLPSLVDVYLILSYDTIKTIMQYAWGIFIHFQIIDVYSSNPHM